TGHDDVGIDLGARALGVVEVAEGRPVDDPDAERSDGAGDRQRCELAAGDELGERELERHVGAGDRRAAGPAVGLEDVAVDPDRPLAERLEVDDYAERPADQPLNLDRAAVRASPLRIPLLALAGRG